jgi:hypothetical protein
MDNLRGCHMEILEEINSKFNRNLKETNSKFNKKDKLISTSVPK